MIVVRLLIPVAELDLFNSLVSPFEQEAYDILKCRSGAYKRERHELEEPLAHNANVTHVFCITSWLAHCHSNCRRFIMQYFHWSRPFLRSFFPHLPLQRVPLLCVLLSVDGLHGDSLSHLFQVRAPALLNHVLVKNKLPNHLPSHFEPL